MRHFTHTGPSKALVASRKVTYVSTFTMRCNLLAGGAGLLAESMGWGTNSVYDWTCWKTAIALVQ